MNTKNIISGILLIATILSVFTAIVTMVPLSSIEEANVLGFKSVCPFAPVSTVMLLFAAYTLYEIRKKKFIQ